MPLPPAVDYRDGALVLLDQTRLPGEVVQDVYTHPEDVVAAIRRLSVRGAPAIGIAAAYGATLGLAEARDPRRRFEDSAAALRAARPTAVNLMWAIDRLRHRAEQMTDVGLADALLVEARAIHAEDRLACRSIGEYGRPLVEAHPNVLTHCNAGALAVSEMGTALAPIYAAARAGAPVHVYVDETRPLLQGARLTALELHEAGIALSLITDSMAAHVIGSGRVDMAIVGADRVAANGDVANKIGTLGVAIACSHFGVPFYVACPYSTIDPATAHGADIPIEERDGAEVLGFNGQRTAPDVSTYNPAFDVTPAALVAGFVTERGVVQPPFTP